MGVQTRSSAARTHQRLTRSSPGRNKAAEFTRIRANVTSLGRKLRNKELASLGVGEPNVLRPSSTALPSSRARTSYSLRSRDRGKAVVGSAIVKSGTEKKSGSKRQTYDGPGYSVGAGRARNVATRDCVICAESKKLPDYPGANLSADCAHEPGACRACVAKHAITEIERGVLFNKVSCVECRSTLGKDEIRRHVWREDWENLETTANRKAEERHTRFRWCQTANCSSGQIHKSYKSPMVTCVSCGAKSCFNHRTPWHEGYSCESYDDSHPDAISARSSEERVKSMAKKCPGKGCDHYVEKDGGCNHMYCSRCGQTWVWDKVKYSATRTMYQANAKS